MPEPTNFISTYSQQTTSGDEAAKKVCNVSLIKPGQEEPNRDYEFDPTKPWYNNPFTNPNRRLTFVPITVSGNGQTDAAKASMQLDSGASINIISYDLAVSLVGEYGIDTTGKQCRVQGIGGHVLPTMGSVMLEIDLTGRTTEITEKVEFHTAKISTVFMVLKRCSVPILMGVPLNGIFWGTRPTRMRYNAVGQLQMAITTIHPNYTLRYGKKFMGKRS